MADLDVITLTEGRAALLKENASNVDDAKLAGWITAVSKRLDRLVGPVVRRTITGEKHNGGHPEVFLRYHPNTSITSVTEYSGTTATVLTAETNASQPLDAYLVDDYEADPTLLGNCLRRRSGGVDGTFPAGRKNVLVTYVPGRFADTGTVDADFKRAADLMLINLWRSQQDSVAQVGEYDVPQNIFPTFAVPRAVREMFDGQIQDPLPL